MPLVLACVLVLILLLLGMLYFSSRNKQLCGYNQIPLHPVYPFGVCCALLTICFWLAVYTKLPGWFHTLARGPRSGDACSDPRVLPVYFDAGMAVAHAAACRARARQ